MPVKFISYPSDPRICVVSALRMYLACTRYKRGDNKAFSCSLIIKPVSRRTISKRIMVVLHRSGINFELFCPQYTSAVATSKASEYSVPLDHILSTSERC